MSSMGVKAMVRSNLKYWLTDALLREGLYQTVSSGQQDIYYNDNSVLTLVDDPSYPSGTVWQSAFKNWVHESGIVVTESGLAPPVVCSGVYVNGIFRARTSGNPSFSASYEHKIDFRNGRVLFSSPQSSPIQAAFSYKLFTVEQADEKENENRPLLIETSWKDNPLQTGVQVYPTAKSITLPAIFIEFLSRTQKGYEIGSANTISELRGVFHVWSRDSFMADMVEDILASKEQNVIVGIDFNRADYPLDSDGDKNAGFTSWDEMANINHPYRWRRIYIDDISTKTQSPLVEIQRSRIDFLARVYPNF